MILIEKFINREILNYDDVFGDYNIDNDNENKVVRVLKYIILFIIHHIYLKTKQNYTTSGEFTDKIFKIFKKNDLHLHLNS